MTSIRFAGTTVVPFNQELTDKNAIDLAKRYGLHPGANRDCHVFPYNTGGSGYLVVRHEGQFGECVDGVLKATLKRNDQQGVQTTKLLYGTPGGLTALNAFIAENVRSKVTPNSLNVKA